MAGHTPLLWAACALGLAAVAVLRFAWSLPHRSARWNAAGWSLLAASVLCGWWSDGAWGVAVAALWTMAAAFTALLAAGWRSPPGRAKVSDRRVGMLPEGNEPRRIGRRVATFLLVIPGGLLAALALAIVVRGVGPALGWGEANANTLALYTVPLAWAILAVALLMQTRRSQIVTLLACGLASAPFLLAGVGS